MLFDRTFHPDEANQAFTTGRLLETGSYKYQPQDHHGPTLYYAAAVLQRSAGNADTSTLNGTLLRCTPLVFAVIAVILGMSALKRLSRNLLPGIVLAFLLCTAPMFVFFATDFIQEMLLVSFLVMMFWAGTGYLRPGSKFKPGTWALLFGTATGLAFATKETCLLSFASAAVAALPFLCRRGMFSRLRERVCVRDLILATGGFMLTSVILYSDLGRDFSGVYNAFVAAPLSYMHRGVGDASTSTGANWHVHPWWWYASLLLGGKSLYSLATIGLVLLSTVLALLKGAGRSTRYVLLYAVVLFSIHSVLPYKTPWCMLPVVSALAFSSALGIAGVQLRGKWAFRAAIPLVFAVCAAQSAATIRMNRDPDAFDIPYNYAAASPEVKDLASVVDEAMKTPSAQRYIAVALPPEDTWPFPWYSRSWKKTTAYWTSFDDLVAIQKAGIKPSVVIVPMEEGHLVQPLFPHLKNTRRFYMRPKIKERNVKGVRVRVFW